MTMARIARVFQSKFVTDFVTFNIDLVAEVHNFVCINYELAEDPIFSDVFKIECMNFEFVLKFMIIVTK